MPRVLDRKLRDKSPLRPAKDDSRNNQRAETAVRLAFMTRPHGREGGQDLPTDKALAPNCCDSRARGSWSGAATPHLESQFRKGLGGSVAVVTERWGQGTFPVALAPVADSRWELIAQGRNVQAMQGVLVRCRLRSKQNVAMLATSVPIPR